MSYQVKSIKVNGQKFSYFDEGEGIPLIALHGWISGKEIFTPMIDFLKDRYRLIALDLPGFGESDPMSGSHAMDKYSDVICEFTKALGLEKYYMIGTSTGGTIILHHSYKYPERVLRSVLSSPFYHYGQFPKLTGYRLTSFVLGNIVRFTLIQKFLHIQLFIFSKVKKEGMIKGNTSEELWEKNKVVVKGFGEKLKLTPTKVIGETLSELMRTNIEDMLKDIKTDTMIFWAKSDHIFHVKWAYRLNNLLPNSRLYIFKKGSHYSITEKMDVISDELRDFLPTSI